MNLLTSLFFFFFFNDTATTEIYTLSLHDALPIFSTYRTVSGTRVAAIIVDLSEDLRSREDLSLDYLLKKSRILMSAAAHEVRNLCGAVLVVYNNLLRVKELQDNEDFHALGTLVQSLQRVSALELQAAPGQNAAVVELKTEIGR